MAFDPDAYLKTPAKPAFDPDAYLGDKPAKPVEAAKPPKEPSTMAKLATLPAGIGENVLSGVTGTAGRVVGGLAGLASSIVHGDASKGADTVKSVENAMTYQPRTAGGQMVQRGLGMVPQATGAAGDFINKGLSNPGQAANPRATAAAETAVSTTMNEVPEMLGMRGGMSTSGALETPPRFKPDSPQVTIPKQAVDAGLKIPPQMAGTTSPVAKVLGWVGGKTATEHQASAMNEAALPALAAKDLGLPEGTPILPANLKPIRQEYGSLVNQITRADTATKQGVGLKGAAGPQASNPVWRADDTLRDAAHQIWSDRATIAAHEGKPMPKEFSALRDVLSQTDYPPGYAMPKIKSLRAEATESYRKGDYQLGAAQKATANALEDFVGRGLEKTGQPELLEKFQSMRQRVAKSYDYEAAADDMGNINAAKLAKIGNDKPLSGNAKTIATAANQYPRAFQSTARTGGSADHSVASLGTAAVEGAQGNIGTALGILAGRPLARKALLSDYGQRNWAIPQSIPRVSSYQEALALAHNNPQALALILQANQIQPPPRQ